MSASASKKKRKELEEQGLSAKDVAAKKEKEKKAKLLRNVLLVVLVVVVALAAIFAVIKLVNRPSYDVKAAAATVGEEKITVPMYDYFYNLTASNFYSSYSFLIQAGVPLSEQSNFFGEGSLEDYMKESTNSTLREVFNVCAKAKADGYKLSDEQKETIKTAMDSLETEAASYGFASVDKYLQARFGVGCDTDSYEEYLKAFLTYTGYTGKLNDEFNPGADEIQAAYDKDPSAYDLVSFTYATSAAESTTVVTEKNTDTEKADDSAATTEEPAATTTVYTDEAKAAAKEKADEYAKEMPEDATTTTYGKSSVSSYFSEDIANWLFDDARKEGDVMVFAKTEEEIYFYTIRFDSRDTNDYHPINANIITVTKDKEDAELKEGEQSAKEKFDALVAAVKEGMSDEEFSTAVTALSYSGSTTSVTKSYSLEEIRSFLFDESRKAGDLLTTYESDSAYYLVRFSSAAEDTYRDSMVKSNLWNDLYEEIATANEITVDEELLKHAYTDLTFNASTSE